MSESDDTDDDASVRGRRESQRVLETSTKRHTRTNTASTVMSNKPHRDSSVSHSGGSRRTSPVRVPERMSFTRERSPAVHLGGNGFVRPSSPALVYRAKQSVPLQTRYLLPGIVNLTFSLPFTKSRWMVSIDMRQAAENLLLLCSLAYCADKIRANAGEPFSPDMWMSIGENTINDSSCERRSPSSRVVFINRCFDDLLLYNTPRVVKGIVRLPATCRRFHRPSSAGITPQHGDEAWRAGRDCQPQQEGGEGLPLDDSAEELQVRVFFISAGPWY